MQVKSTAGLDVVSSSSAGMTLRFPDGVLVTLTPDEMAVAIAVEAFRKRWSV